MATTIDWLAHASSPACAWSAQGDLAFVACEKGISVLDAASGRAVDEWPLEDAVTALDCAPGARWLAAAGKSSVVALDTRTGRAGGQYSAQGRVQCLAMDPLGECILVGTGNGEAALVSLQEAPAKSLSPTKIALRDARTRGPTLCAAWSPDGNSFGLGFSDGSIGVCDRSGSIRAHLPAESAAPVWTLVWASADALVAGDFAGRVRVINGIDGHVVSTAKTTSHEPFPAASGLVSPAEGLVVLAGSRGTQWTLWAAAGATLVGTLPVSGALGAADGLASTAWVSRLLPHPRRNSVFLAATQGGKVACVSVHVAPVHALDNDIYARRDCGTQLMLGRVDSGVNLRVAARLKRAIEQIAVRGDRVAVAAASGAVMVFRFDRTDPAGTCVLENKARVATGGGARILLLVNGGVLVGTGSTLSLFPHGATGRSSLQWSFSSPLSYARVAAGGPSGKELVLVGLASGEVRRLFADCGSTTNVVLSAGGRGAIQWLAPSAERRSLAVVDDAGQCVVVPLAISGFPSAPPLGATVTTAVFHEHIEGLLCLSLSDGRYAVRMGDSGAAVPALPLGCGNVEGGRVALAFSGARLLCYEPATRQMQSVALDLAPAAAACVDSGNWADAHTLMAAAATSPAHLRRRAASWRELAERALAAGESRWAQRLYALLGDDAGVALATGSDDAKALAEELAGRLRDAAARYRALGQPQRAVAVLADAGLWDEAGSVARAAGLDAGPLAARRAATLLAQASLPSSTGEAADAVADELVAMGDAVKAVALLAQSRRAEKLGAVARRLHPRTDATALARAATALRQMDRPAWALEALVRLGDPERLSRFLVAQGQWPDALRVAESHPAVAPAVFHDYADWLAEQDRFADAREYYARAGALDRAQHVLQRLAANALREACFDDAGFYHWQLAQALDGRTLPTAARVYHALHSVRRWLDDGFSASSPRALLQKALFVLNSVPLGAPALPAVSRTAVYYAVARLAPPLGAFSLARSVHERLAKMQLPREWRAQSRADALHMRAAPRRDAPELLPRCPACLTVNPLLRDAGSDGKPPAGNRCVLCGHPLFFSAWSGDPLPLVRFAADPRAIGDFEAAKKLLAADPPLPDDLSAAVDAAGAPSSRPDILAVSPIAAPLSHNRFEDILHARRAVLATDPNGGVFTDDGRITVASAMALRAIPRHLVLADPARTPGTFLKQVCPAPDGTGFLPDDDSDLYIVQCPSCLEVFADDEWAYAFSRTSSCPVCRTSSSACPSSVLW